MLKLVIQIKVLQEIASVELDRLQQILPADRAGQQVYMIVGTAIDQVSFELAGVDD